MVIELSPGQRHIKWYRKINTSWH